MEVIKGLHKRGYKLGIISNLIGENEVPDWLEEDGLDSYFDTVILSSDVYKRQLWRTSGSMTKAAILPFRVCWIFCTLTASI